MNKVVLMGRLTKEPAIRYTVGEQPVCIARYTLAVDRRRRQQEGEQSADFISCVAFGKNGEFAEKYLTKGMKILLEGHIQTGRYEKDGKAVYTTDVVVESQEFAESKRDDSGRAAMDDAEAARYAGQQAAGAYQSGQQARQMDLGKDMGMQKDYGPMDGFMNLPPGIDEELPFN